jgi:hypothetical protein
VAVSAVLIIGAALVIWNFYFLPESPVVKTQDQGGELVFKASDEKRSLEAKQRQEEELKMEMEKEKIAAERKRIEDEKRALVAKQRQEEKLKMEMEKKKIAAERKRIEDERGALEATKRREEKLEMEMEKKNITAERKRMEEEKRALEAKRNSHTSPAQLLEAVIMVSFIINLRVTKGIAWLFFLFVKVK